MTSNKFTCPVCGQSKFSIVKDKMSTRIYCNICGTSVKYIEVQKFHLETPEEKLNYKKFFDNAKKNINKDDFNKDDSNKFYFQHDDSKIEQVLFEVYRIASNTPEKISDRVRYILMKINSAFFQSKTSDVKILAFNAWYAYAEYSDFLESHLKVRIGKYAEILYEELISEEKIGE